MRLRNVWGDYSLPEYKLTPEQRKNVTMLAHEKYLSAGVLWGTTLAIAVPGLVLMALSDDYIAPVIAAIGISQPEIMAIIFVVVLVSIVSVFVYPSIYVRPVRRAMLDLGFEICVRCGYRLAGLGDDVDRCPECGGERVRAQAGEVAEEGADG